MGGELRGNAETTAFAPAGAELSGTTQSNQDMFESRHLFAPFSGSTPEPTSLDFGSMSELYGTNALIAQAPSETEYGRGSDGRWHFQNPRVKPGQDIAGKIKEWLWNDAQNLPGDVAKATINSVWNVSVGAAEAVNRHFGTNHIPEGATMDYLSGIVKNPEKYEQAFRKINPTACDQAYKAFGLDQLGIDKNLIPSIIWNEQLHRKPITDDAQDVSTTLGLRQKPGESVGPAQIQLQNIQALAEKYPQLKEWGDPVKAALDPAKAPYFVAAYLANEADNIRNYNEQHAPDAGFQPIPINSDTLALYVGLDH